MEKPKITIKWNGEEAVINYNAAYDESYPILKADMLKDAMFELEHHYNSLLKGRLFPRKREA